MFQKCCLILGSGYYLSITCFYILVKTSIHYLPIIIDIVDVSISYGYQVTVILCRHFFDVDLDIFFKIAIPLEEVPNVNNDIVFPEPPESADDKNNKTETNKNPPEDGLPNIFTNYEVLLLLVSPICVLICVLMKYYN